MNARAQPSGRGNRRLRRGVKPDPLPISPVNGRIGHNGGPPLNDNGQAVSFHIGEKFLQLFEPARHKAFYGGRGSAKSHSFATVLVVLSSMRQKRIVCARQFQNSIRDSVKELLELKINELRLRNQFYIGKTDIVHEGTGSRYSFIGLDRNPDSAKSLEGADICWVEEARTINQHSMDILIPTIRRPGSEIWWSWNPEQREDPVDAYFRGNKAADLADKFGETLSLRRIVQQVGIADNPFFYHTPMAAEMWFMMQHNFARYEHIWLGGYDEAFDTKVFSNVVIGRIDLPSYAMPRYGIDFGFGSAPSAIVKVYILEAQKAIYIAREWKGCVSSKDLPAALDSVIEDRSDYIKADSAMPDTIETLATEGFNIHGARKGPGSVKAGINWLQGYTIYIDPDCEEMRDEARLYSWQVDKITKKVLNVPVDAHNHLWDAVRYATEDVRVGDDSADDEDGGVLKLRW